MTRSGMLTPESTVWKVLEFYGTRVRHRGKWRLHEILRNVLRIDYSGDLEVRRRGLQWVLNPGDFVQSSFYWTGEFEGWEWEHLVRVLPEQGVFFDVGANFGYYALMLARTSRAKVFAFEPHPETFARLRTNIALNALQDLITPVPIGLSDRQESGYLDAVPGNTGGSFVAASGTAIVLDTLDHYCEMNGIGRVDLIKLDVEGHEPHVIKGATRLLEACRPALMVEFNPAALTRAGSSVNELEAMLRAFGYQLFLPGRKRLVPFRNDPTASSVVNVVGLHGADPGRQLR